MGVTNLLPFLKPITKESHVSKYENEVLGVDMMCWIHRGLISCAYDVVMGNETEVYLNYIKKMVEMHDEYNIRLLFVFDGEELPEKREENKMRRDKREKAKEEAWDISRNVPSPQTNETVLRKCMQALSITKQIRDRVKYFCEENSFDYVIAPYEADAQLAYLCRMGYITAVITEDSDLLAYGCPRVLFKLKDTGECSEISLFPINDLVDFNVINKIKNPLSDFNNQYFITPIKKMKHKLIDDKQKQQRNERESKNDFQDHDERVDYYAEEYTEEYTEEDYKYILEEYMNNFKWPKELENLKDFNIDMFLSMCILSGCDYTNDFHINRMGIKTAYKLIHEHRKMKYVLLYLMSDVKWKEKIPVKYHSIEKLMEKYTEIKNAFLNHEVYDLILKIRIPISKSFKSISLEEYTGRQENFFQKLTDASLFFRTRNKQLLQVDSTIQESIEAFCNSEGSFYSVKDSFHNAKDSFYNAEDSFQNSETIKECQTEEHKLRQWSSEEKAQSFDIHYENDERKFVKKYTPTLEKEHTTYSETYEEYGMNTQDSEGMVETFSPDMLRFLELISSGSDEGQQQKEQTEHQCKHQQREKRTQIESGQKLKKVKINEQMKITEGVQRKKRLKNVEEEEQQEQQEQQENVKKKEEKAIEMEGNEDKEEKMKTLKEKEKLQNIKAVTGRETENSNHEHFKRKVDHDKSLSYDNVDTEYYKDRKMFLSESLENLKNKHMEKCLIKKMTDNTKEKQSNVPILYTENNIFENCSKWKNIKTNNDFVLGVGINWGSTNERTDILANGYICKSDNRNTRSNATIDHINSSNNNSNNNNTVTFTNTNNNSSSNNNNNSSDNNKDINCVNRSRNSYIGDNNSYIQYNNNNNNNNNNINKDENYRNKISTTYSAKDIYSNMKRNFLFFKRLEEAKNPLDDSSNRFSDQEGFKTSTEEKQKRQQKEQHEDFQNNKLNLYEQGNMVNECKIKMNVTVSEKTYDTIDVNEKKEKYSTGENIQKRITDFYTKIEKK